MAPSSSGKDTALSTLPHRFESGRGHYLEVAMDVHHQHVDFREQIWCLWTNGKSPDCGSGHCEFDPRQAPL